MSYCGKFTPLQLNVLGSLTQSSGFAVNASTSAIQGIWTPTGYTAGSLVTDTVIRRLTEKIPLVYAAIVAGTTAVTADTYRNLISIGSGVCPALGNSIPSTFLPSWAGWGTWTGVTIGSPTTSGSLEINGYPPKGNFDSTTGKWQSGVTSYSWMEQAYGSYGWISGWPGYNAWQKDTDTYKTVIEPSPGDPVNTYGYDEYFSGGFIAVIARQAYYEMWTDQINQYPDMTTAFSQTSGFKNRQNQLIASYVNSKTFMSGTYSNINDLSTSDISGVTQAFKIWGGDLINSGRAINLNFISEFGLPSALLKNLQLPQNNAITDPLKLALMMPPGLGGGNFSVQELQAILLTDSTPTTEQEQRIYKSFKLIRGGDLDSILYNLNCKTIDLVTLADLLDPRKLFPNSFNSLTVPQYNFDPSVSSSSKIYYFIYTDGGVNKTITNWGQRYLDGILPEDLIYSCGAFSLTMQQIKNIKTMNIEKFSQVVANMELPSYNNTEINTANGVSVDIGLVDIMLANYALGSGNSGSYCQSDFFGAAAGYPYKGYYELVKQYIDQLPTSNLATIYQQIYNADLTTITDVAFQALITAANTEIVSLTASYSQIVSDINYYWDAIGKQLYIEQRAIPLAITSTTDLIQGVSPNSLGTFVGQLENYAAKNSPCDEGAILALISDESGLAGQSIVGAMREARNAARLSLAGGVLENNVSDVIDVCAASAVATVVNGVITSVTVTNAAGGYLQSNPPSVTVYPLLVERQAKLSVELREDGSISNIVVLDGGLGYSQYTVVVEITPPPQCEYPNPPQQTYSDTPWSRLVPPELVAPANSSPGVSEAITAVTECNCDCWSV